MKVVRKENLPQKVCITCNRPFTWRKKWAKVWDEVKYCSEKCKAGKKKLKFQSGTIDLTFFLLL